MESGTIIRKTLPIHLSLGILLLMFTVSWFLSHQIFTVRVHDLDENTHVYFGMGLVSIALMNMVLITWEEILFPIKLKKVEGGVVFKNHRNKLKTQVLIYCPIPLILAFIYFTYDVNHFRFFIWAAICLIPPVVDKIVSGINNYNDYLMLTDTTIEYKNNSTEGHFMIKDIQEITIIKDNQRIIKKIQLSLAKNRTFMIDLDEMELDAFYDSINKYIYTNYPQLVR
jgi:hypothetical protein